jgi:two-component system, sensor histidine kinase PdtaS
MPKSKLKTDPNLFSKLHRLAEQTLEGLQKQDLQSEIHEADQLLHELQVHQIELEMQNEELRRTQEKLYESNEKYQELYDYSPVGYLTLNEKGLILQANLSSCTMLSVDRKSLLDKPFGKHVFQEDQNTFFLHIRQAFNTGKRQKSELRLLNHGVPFFALMESIAKKKEGNSFSQSLTVITDISNLKFVEAELRSSLEEKQVLLKEVHHRVKNNLQIVTSLLQLQSEDLKKRGATIQATQNTLVESRSRIHSMALIHERLYQADNLSKITFDNYIKSLIHDLIIAYGISTRRITMELELSSVNLGIEQAIPCGLIINELVSNSFKHAFSENKMGAIRISLEFNQTTGIYELIVADNGCGFPDGIGWNTYDSLGIQLVSTLITQIQGTIELCDQKGACFRIRFKENNP